MPRYGQPFPLIFIIAIINASIGFRVDVFHPMAFPYFYYQFNKLINPEMNTPETW